MNFGKWIVVSFVVFAAFIATLVAVCVRQDISLVRKDYYQTELMHQVKMDRLRNAGQLAQLPAITIKDGWVEITFDQFDAVDTGVLTIMRPSDAKLDHSFPLSASQVGSKRYQLKAWKKGLYRVSMEWSMNGRDYAYENTIVI